MRSSFILWRTALMVLCVTLLLLSVVASARAAPSCADVFACHRNGHRCPDRLRHNTTTTTTTTTTRAGSPMPRAPPLALSPGDGAVQQTCLFRAPLLDNAAARRARTPSRVEDGVFILLGQPEAAAHAPLHSPHVLFFQNMTDSYLQWHPESRVGATVRELEGRDRTTLSAPDTDESGHHHHRSDPDDEGADVFEHDRPSSVPGRSWRVTRLVQHMTAGGLHRLQQLAAQVRQYPWQSPAAVERLFFRRELRLQYRLASLVAIKNRDAHGQQEKDKEEEEEEEKVVDEDDAVDLASLQSASTAALFSVGSLRGLSVVSFPATPLFAPSTATEAHDVSASASSSSSSPSSTSPTRISLASENVVYTCDFRTVRAAQQHVEEGADYARQAEVSGFGLDAADPLADLEAVEYDLADVFDVAGAAARSSSAPRQARSRRTPAPGKRFSLIAYALSYWLPGSFGSAGGSSSSSSAAAAAATARASRSPSQHAAAALLAQVHEELGPFQPSRTLLPSAVKQLLGVRTVETHQQLRLTSSTVSSSSSAAGGGSRRRERRRVNYDFVLSVALPSTRCSCLAITLSPIADVTRLMVAGATDTDTRRDGRGGDDVQAAGERSALGTVPVHVTEGLVFDWLWLKLLVGFTLLTWMRPRVEDSRLLRFVTAGMCGTLILLVLLVFYLVRHLQKMSIGKVGLAVAVTMGGMAAFAEGVASVVQYLLFSLQDQLTSEVWLYLGVAVLGISILSSVLVQWLFSEAVLQNGTRLGLRLVAGLALGLTYQRNREATVLALLVTRVLFQPRLLYRALWWCSGAGRVDNTQSDPVESVPSWARKAVRYSTPLVAEGQRYGPRPRTADDANDKDNADETEAVGSGFSASVQQKMRQYEADGALHTRLALEQLAAHLRANPERYVDRVKDPNRLYRWAGCVHPDEDGDWDEEEEGAEEEGEEEGQDSDTGGSH